MNSNVPARNNNSWYSYTTCGAYLHRLHDGIPSMISSAYLIPLISLTPPSRSSGAAWTRVLISAENEYMSKISLSTPLTCFSPFFIGRNRDASINQFLKPHEWPFIVNKAFSLQKRRLYNFNISEKFTLVLKDHRPMAGFKRMLPLEALKSTKERRCSCC